ncbi:DUF2812 domain-containing protein [Lacrimispora sp. NSJ-141]|uniref:DUF2812 domain-containing protein n=1 Tax=Lientehia hominis TaxID=2897778 RepID=A0AAP2RHL4_9FIRM|nr:DUF2812 domain-containing protein [Lientehia hominis]MCD2492302.1 DUF2812 domain-containing protein [Lientehia hominis]
MGQDKNDTKKVFKWYISLMKERLWLEEQSKKGWLLRDVTMGVFYTFDKSGPVHMVYDVERFDLSKNPTKREIEEKTDLMDMAVEMGWKTVCHDEGQNYYLAKPYAEGEINELYDSPEDRARRAERYRSFFMTKVQLFIWIDILILLLGICFYYSPGTEEVAWFSAFSMIYVAVCLILCIIFLRWGNLYAKELRLSLDEWTALYGRNDMMAVRKVVLTIGGLERFLEKKAQEGYHVKDMRIFRYFFSKGEPGQYSYMMDTRYLTNKRRKKAGAGVFKDEKDWEGCNNDWQVQSLREAEAAGWEFVGAVESRNILYRAEAGSGAVPLNDERYKKGIRITSAFGGMAVFVVVCGLVGAVIGGIVGALM